MVGVFARKYPSVHLDVTEINVANPFEPVSDGSCDVLCLRKTDVFPED